MQPARFAPALLLTALAAGCTPGQDADAAPAADTTTTAFTGDFQGPLGLQLWSVREMLAKDVPGTLAWVKAQGFDEVETAGVPQGYSAAQFRAALDSAGLRATAMHVDFNQLKADPAPVLAQADTLGATDVGVAWISHEGAFTLEMARSVAADFNAIGAAAKAAGKRFYYHNHGYEFQPAAGDTIPFDVLVAATDPASVFYEMDVFWTARPGVDPAALLRKYPGRWKLMHIKDMAAGTPTGDYTGAAPTEANVAVGSGAIDYAEVLKAANEVGLERFYVEDETAAPEVNIPVSVNYLRGVAYRP